jgi:hypothetical protein
MHARGQVGRAVNKRHWPGRGCLNPAMANVNELAKRWCALAELARAPRQAARAGATGARAARAAAAAGATTAATPAAAASSAAAAPSAAAAAAARAATAAAATATTAAATAAARKLQAFAEVRGSAELLVEDIERGEADVGDFRFTQRGDRGQRRALRRHIGRRRHGRRRAAGHRQRHSSGSPCGQGYL